MAEMERLYTARQAAALLDWHHMSIYRAVAEGRLRAVRIGRGRGVIRIPESAIAEIQVPRPINAAREYAQPKATKRRKKA